LDSGERRIALQGSWVGQGNFDDYQKLRISGMPEWKSISYRARKRGAAEENPVFRPSQQP